MAALPIFDETVANQGKTAFNENSLASMLADAARFTGIGNNYCNVGSGNGQLSADTAADLMSNLEGNAISECPPADHCGIEVRMERGQMTAINIRCMSQKACTAAQSQNFVGVLYTHMQCRPEASLQHRRYGASTCRGCVKACSDPSTGCFDPTKGITDDTTPTAISKFPWTLVRSDFEKDMVASNYENNLV